ncbi:hypothetical protein [Bacillus mycoides]
MYVCPISSLYRLTCRHVLRLIYYKKNMRL